MSAIKDKIELLLAKAEATDNEHERDTYNAKAESLMLKYGIEQAELEAAGKAKAEDIVQVQMSFTSPFHAIIGGFVQGICNSLGNLNVLQQKGFKQRQISIWIIGYKTDVQHAEALVTSLWNQANLAVGRWSRGPAKEDPFYAYADSQGRWKARRQFVVSFGYEVADRIRRERTVEEANISAGASLVLVGKKEKVDEWMYTQHNVRQARRSALHGSNSGHAAGRAAGRQANIGRGELT